MKISYNWLQEYFDTQLPNPKELADLLNLRTLEVEDVEEKDGDSVFEIKVTPNRAPDCLSHVGIAKEVAIHTGLKVMHKKEPDTVPIDFESSFSIQVQEGSCIRYMAREIRNVVVSESPLELKIKLESIGQRSINTIVDITNLVMYEIGQPMHAFDKNKLTGNIIKVASPIDTHFLTLDNKDVELTSDDITIQDQEDNLAIAGIKGGKKAEVDFYTKDIILESANFFPVKVRKTSRRTTIQTDSSKRFENGLTPELASRALTLACVYIKKFASDQSTQFSNILDVYPRPQKRKYVVGLSFKNIAKKLGVEIPQSQIEDIFSNLGIGFEIINSRQNILKYAQDAIGKPYMYGASVLFDAPNTFDCASLTAYVYSMGGIALPRISIDQYVFAKPVSRDLAQPGDLIFANTGNTIQHGIWYESKEFLAGTKVPKGVDHVGIYLGDNQVLHANSKTGDVAVESLDTSEYFKDIRGFGTCIEDETTYLLHIPYERLDLKTEIDVIEEIGRVFGYEHITPIPLVLPMPTKISLYDKISTIKSSLIDMGFDEVITYSFGKKGDVSVIKPLAKDKACLRKNLFTGLSDALELNFRNKELFAEDTVKIFEIGHVFNEDAEKTVLAIGVKTINKKIKTKQILEEIISVLSGVIQTEIKIDIKDNQEIIEIDLDSFLGKDFSIINTLKPLEHIIYTPFSIYPYSTRDIAVWASHSKTKDDIEKIIRQFGTNLLIRFDLFDQFTKENRTSYAYRLVFQSFDRTLTDEEINSIMDTIYNALKNDPDFEIR
jgi:phenylalanyl-tRNA synthetase beta subunit